MTKQRSIKREARDGNRCRRDFEYRPSRCPRCGLVFKTPFGLVMHEAMAAKFKNPGHEDVAEDVAAEMEKLRD